MDLAARIEQIELSITSLARAEFGDYPGHPFRGNQHTDGGGEGRTPDSGFNDMRTIEQMRQSATTEYSHIKDGDPARLSTEAIRARNAGNDVLYRALKSEEREARKGLRNLKAYNVAASALEFGDYPGHPFRGNQHTDGGGRTDKVGAERTGKGADIIRFPRGRAGGYNNGLAQGAKTLSTQAVRDLKPGDPIAVWLNGQAHPAEVNRHQDDRAGGRPRLTVTYYPERPPEPAPAERPDNFSGYGVIKGIANVGQHDIYSINALAPDVRANMPSDDERDQERDRIQPIAASLALEAGEWVEFRLADDDQFTLTASGFTPESSTLTERISEIELAVISLGWMEFVGDYPGHPFRGNQWTDATGTPKDAGGRPITEGMAKGVTEAANKGLRKEEANRAAKELLVQAKKAEPAMTAVLMGIAKHAGGEMRGLDNRLKFEDSLTRKIGDKSIENGISIDQAASEIGDALRYTLAAPAADLPMAAIQSIRELRSQGHEILDKNIENYFSRGDTYNGINVNGTTVDGTPFELQFHTPESAVLKEPGGPLHPLYEVYRKLETPPTEKAVLFAEMSRISDAIPQPPATILTIGTPLLRTYDPETNTESRIRLFPARSVYAERHGAVI